MYGTKFVIVLTSKSRPNDILSLELSVVYELRASIIVRLIRRVVATFSLLYEGTL